MSNPIVRIRWEQDAAAVAWVAMEEGVLEGEDRHVYDETLNVQVERQDGTRQEYDPTYQTLPDDVQTALDQALRIHQDARVADAARKRNYGSAPLLMAIGDALYDRLAGNVDQEGDPISRDEIDDFLIGWDTIWPDKIGPLLDEIEQTFLNTHQIQLAGDPS